MLQVLRITRGHFEGNAWPLLKRCRIEWERRSHCLNLKECIMDGIANHFLAKKALDCRILYIQSTDTRQKRTPPPVLGPRHQFPFGSPAFPLFTFYETATANYCKHARTHTHTHTHTHTNTFRQSDKDEGTLSSYVGRRILSMWRRTAKSGAGAI